MSVPFHMSRTSISRHVMATCQVIWDVLHPLELPTPTAEQWRMIAKRFGDLWDYPFAIGALDGKHIALQNPANSGSMYYNYKGYPSVVLMALSDADSCFILVDCGQYGRISDAGVYNISRISTLLEEKQLDIPTATFKISGSDIDIPFMIIGDEAFPLKPYLMKPFAARTLNAKRRLYNYRHSRARRAVECAFGIMSRKFEVFQRPMRVQPDKAVLLTNAAVCLHNFIRRRDGNLVDSSSTVTYEVMENRGDGMQPLAINARGGRATDEAIAIRDGIADFFSVPDGSVHWQNKLVFRHVLRPDGE
ncbi:hypothetical protein RRG08_011014 [Elysia crispata]|uniref:DDE Tnp4 domain-containing protein n=1 Tax=Elysia crispata TaxID=231223 RepID=A0AAE1DKB8_9GAST|nr:hypothetical protein RRG08_011014 [Elysia crispata]